MERVHNSRYYLNRRGTKRILFKRVRFILIVATIIFLGRYFINFASSNLQEKEAIITENNSNIIKDIDLKNTSVINNNHEENEKIAVTLASPPQGDDKEIIKKPDEKIVSVKETTSTFESISILKDELESYIQKYEGQYGIYYYNLENNDEFGINSEDEYIAASTIKIPLNLYLYSKINTGTVNPKGLLPYLKQDYEEGTGKIQYETFGNKYSVKELSKLSITISDNVATNILFRFLGQSNVKENMRQLGGIVVDNNQNLSCPKDMGLYMKRIYEFYREGSPLGLELMNSFLNTQFNDRIPDRLPEKVKVAHKIGTQTSVCNDVGIVFAKTPYIISVMSKDINEDEAASVIANISKKIYDYSNSKM